ncbi:MAG: hypothetical protein KKA84_06030 [Bacteroidetes bacterium]|nr:hypothetical protein [Bacteroidota bacterium]
MENNKMNPEVFDACPHCGNKLSPWQQVLLSVDKAVMCKHCWYRIILSNPEEEKNKENDNSNDGDE